MYARSSFNKTTTAYCRRLFLLSVAMHKTSSAGRRGKHIKLVLWSCSTRPRPQASKEVSQLWLFGSDPRSEATVTPSHGCLHTRNDTLMRMNKGWWLRAIWGLRDTNIRRYDCECAAEGPARIQNLYDVIAPRTAAFRRQRTAWHVGPKEGARLRVLRAWEPVPCRDLLLPFTLTASCLRLNFPGSPAKT